MNLVFAHPAAAWALLGIPAVLAIHFLQERARVQRVSTLFLLDHLAPESRGVVRFERLRNSLPLWLQLLAVLLLAWVLAGPRWLREDTRQSIVIVLDDAVSMSAYLPETRALLTARLTALNAAAAHTDWTLLESDPAQPALYHGPQLTPLLEALTRWQPQLGTHDPANALRLAQNLLRGPGLVVFVTNHAVEIPGGIALLSAAKPRENVGFTGANVQEQRWRALVKNYGAQTQSRAWWARSGDQDFPRQTLTLAPQQTVLLEGTFPPGRDRCELHLEDDALAVDNVLPILRPQPKKLTVAADDLTTFVEKFPNTQRGTADADVAVLRYDPAQPMLADRPAIGFPKVSDTLATGWITTAPNALTEGLNWSALLAPHLGALTIQPQDDALVWRGGAPLILRRPSPHGPQLLFNFDPAASNATRLPAFVLLIRRFLEEVRATKIRSEALNVDTHQPLVIACDPLGAPLHFGSQTLPPSAAGTLRAPNTPGFFQIAQGPQVLLDAAAQFADVRESNLTSRAAVDTLGDRTAQLVRANTEADPLTPLWLLLIVSALLGSWFPLSRRRAA